MASKLLLSDEEVDRNIRIYQSFGDKSGTQKAKALDELTEHFTPLLNMLAAKYYQSSSSYVSDFDDIRQEAFFAFLQCLSKFDLKNGVKLSTYVYSSVSQSLWQYHRDATFGKCNRRFSELLIKVTNARTELRNELNREATIKEIAEKTGIPIEKVRSVVLISKQPISLSKVVEVNDSDDKNILLEDTIEDDFEKDMERKSLIKDRYDLLTETISDFSDEDKMIFKTINGIGTKQLSFRELSEKTGISKSTLNRRYKKMEDTIKERLSGFSIDEFLGD